MVHHVSICSLGQKKVSPPQTVSSLGIALILKKKALKIMAFQGFFVFWCRRREGHFGAVAERSLCTYIYT